MRKVIAFIAIALIFFACSKDEPAKREAAQAKEEKASPPVQASPEETAGEVAARPGKFRLLISPAEASADMKLSLIARGFSLEDAGVTWLINGMEVPSRPDHILHPAEEHFRKGDSIQAVAVVDGIEVYSDMITVSNSKPVITHIKIMPEVFGPGDKVWVEAEAKDADNDPVSLHYEWTKNDIPAGTGKTLEVELKRDDVFTVSVRPNDGEDYGESVTLYREVANMPPMFRENSEYQFIGQDYSFQPRAYDPDGDPITFALKNAPEGMTIDKGTGWVKWVVPADFEGTQSFTVSAKDDKGGEALQTFRLTFEFTNTPAILNTPQKEPAE